MAFLLILRLRARFMLVSTIAWQSFADGKSGKTNFFAYHKNESYFSLGILSQRKEKNPQKGNASHLEVKELIVKKNF